MYNVIDKEEEIGRCFYFMNYRMKTDLRLKIIQNHMSLKWNTVTNCYSVVRIDLFENWLICDFRFLKFSTQISI